MKKTGNKERHVRWNWETSPDEEEMGRYHFVVVDDKNRQGIMDGLIKQIAQTGSIIPIRRVEGKVKRSKLRYLFVSFDSRFSPSGLDLSKTKKSVVQDKELVERKTSTYGIENYIANLYETSS